MRPGRHTKPRTPQAARTKTQTGREGSNAVTDAVRRIEIRSPPLGSSATAKALDGRADSEIAAGNDAALAATYAQLRAAENAFFQPDAPKWQRTLLYDLNGYQSSVLPTLQDTLGADGDAALSTLHTAFLAANAAALPPK